MRKPLTFLIAYLFAFVLVQPPQLAAQYVQFGYNKGGGGGGTPPSVVQTASGSSFCQLPSTIAAGDSIVIPYAVWAGTDPTTITDGGPGYTYVHSITAQTAAQTLQQPGLFIASNVAAWGGSPFNITASGGTGTAKLFCYEVHGPVTAPVLDTGCGSPPCWSSTSNSSSAITVNCSAACLLLNILSSTTQASAAQQTGAGWVCDYGSPCPAAGAPNFYLSAGHLGETSSGAYSLTPAGSVDGFVVPIK
jgi:hypothetical protein